MRVIGEYASNYTDALRDVSRTEGPLLVKSGTKWVKTTRTTSNAVRADVLANTTSLGMTGQPPLDIDLSPLTGSAVVADLVYAPLETALLAAARQRGLKTADGLGMLLHQAVRGFALWFGIRPEVTPELRALVEADLVR